MVTFTGYGASDVGVIDNDVNENDRDVVGDGGYGGSGDDVTDVTGNGNGIGSVIYDVTDGNSSGGVAVMFRKLPGGQTRPA